MLTFILAKSSRKEHFMRWKSGICQTLTKLKKLAITAKIYFFTRYFHCFTFIKLLKSLNFTSIVRLVGQKLWRASAGAL